MPDEILPKTYSEAKRLNAIKYDTGQPCKRGHLSFRWAKNRTCAICHELNRMRNPRYLIARKLWRIANAHKRRAYNISPRGKAIGKVEAHRRRARKALIPGVHTLLDEQNILARARKCHVCGKRFTTSDPPTIDHVLAVASELGSNDAGNLAAAHLSCNKSKRNARFNPITGQGILI